MCLSTSHDSRTPHTLLTCRLPEGTTTNLDVTVQQLGGSLARAAQVHQRCTFGGTVEMHFRWYS